MVLAGNLSLVLQAAASGDEKAADALLPLVYDALRSLARARLAKLPPGATLQATDLVHEAYVDLVGRGDPGWSGRAHFFGAAARAMHDVVVDRARARSAQKRGGDHARVDLDDALFVPLASAPTEDLFALSEALEALGREHPRRRDVAMLRYFVGLSEDEIAELHGVGARTVEREWRFARAWLATFLGGRADSGPSH